MLFDILAALVPLYARFGAMGFPVTEEMIHFTARHGLANQLSNNLLSCGAGSYHADNSLMQSNCGFCIHENLELASRECMLLLVPNGFAVS